MPIHNLIFDFGQVLIHFEPRIMISPYCHHAEDAALLETVIFDRLYWDRLDAGTITDEEVIAAVRDRLPERLKDTAETVYRNWYDHLPEMEGMRELIADVKKRFGVRVFLLSNISKGFAERAEKIPILRLTEDQVFSGVCGLVKPNPEIFTYACKKFGIPPQESLFIDDNPKNIKGAEATGLSTFLFEGQANKLKDFLYMVL